MFSAGRQGIWIVVWLPHHLDQLAGRKLESTKDGAVKEEKNERSVSKRDHAQKKKMSFWSGARTSMVGPSWSDIRAMMTKKVGAPSNNSGPFSFLETTARFGSGLMVTTGRAG